MYMYMCDIFIKSISIKIEKIKNTHNKKYNSKEI